MQRDHSLSDPAYVLASSGQAPGATATRADGAASGLDALLSPRAIAVLGASGREGNPFALPLRYLVEHGFDGEIYPVNPKYDEILGITCFPSLSDLPGPVDLVLMLIPAQEVVRSLPDVAATGARAAIVFASGYAETGDAGAIEQERMVAAARSFNIRLLGPNCQGIVSTFSKVAATFTAGIELGPPMAGNVAYIGQSGAVGGSFLSLARESGMGIGAWVSTGNEADLSALEIGRYIIEDERIKVLALYLESTVDGADYMSLAMRVQELGKAMIVLKSGRSSAGARAAASHTGAMIGPDAGYRAVSRAFGVIEARDVDEFIAVAHGLSSLPRTSGRRVAIVTTSGGAGSLAADQMEEAGLEVPILAAEVQRELTGLVPAFGAVDNPVDVTAQLFRAGEADEFIEVISRVVADPHTDSVVVTVTVMKNDLAVKVMTALAELVAAASKPIVFVWLVAREQSLAARTVLHSSGVPVYASPRVAAQVLRALVAEPGITLESVEASAAVLDLVNAMKSSNVTEAEGDALLKTLGIGRVASHLATSPEQAAVAAEGISGPLVLKIQSPSVIHKTDRGGVRIGVKPEDAVAVYRDLMLAFPESDVEGVLIQELAGDGHELVVGVTNHEPGIPPLITVGLGGVATEVYGDTVTRLAPVNNREAVEMIRELRSAPLFEGFRGSVPIEIDGAAAAISAISRFASAFGDRVSELEINPLRLCEGGRVTVALDFFLQLVEPDHSPASSLGSIHDTPKDANPTREANSGEETP